MPVNVPTIDEFNTLQDRVAALEGGEKPPNPIPPDPGTGKQAKRIADCIELFGVNTFSSMDEHNAWGSWPADYRPDSVIKALRYMTQDSGFAFRIREYHYNGREASQRPWFQAIQSALPGSHAAICPGANASTNDVASMFSLANDLSCGIVWVEGLNEPNTDFGSGEVPIDQTKAIQDAVWGARASATILGPSIVAGIPHPEGWITGYCGADLAAINAAMHVGNGHYYPPGCPGIPGTGYSLDDYVDGLAKAYNHLIDLTEFHPTLYNSEGNKPDQSGWSGERDAFYTLLALFACGKRGTVEQQGIGLWWYALFDYGTSYICGLFPKCGDDPPRPAATTLRNLCSICADPFDNARTFTPGKLDVSVVGLPPNGSGDLYQASDGRFIMPLWIAAKDLGGDPSSVTLEFARNVARVEVFDPLVGPQGTVIAQGAAEASLSFAAGVRLVVIDP